jgi:hypothetical protein
MTSNDESLAEINQDTWADDENSIDSPAMLEMPSPYEGSEEEKQ